MQETLSSLVSRRGALHGNFCGVIRSNSSRLGCVVAVGNRQGNCVSQYSETLRAALDALDALRRLWLRQSVPFGAAVLMGYFRVRSQSPQRDVKVPVSPGCHRRRASHFPGSL